MKGHQKPHVVFDGRGKSMNMDIIKKAVNGDDEQLYLLISDNKKQLYRIAYSYLRNQEDALEAIQETTFRVYKNRHKLKNPQYFKTWVIRILINYCADECKRRKKVLSITKPMDFHVDESKEERLTIDCAIEKLKDKHREVIILKYFEDLTISEIADIMNHPEGTIKTWLSRGLDRLRNILDKDGEFQNV